ncbi:MAG: VCBS repeat-containing protein [Acidobacteriota bacterium]
MKRLGTSALVGTFLLGGLAWLSPRESAGSRSAGRTGYLVCDQRGRPCLSIDGAPRIRLHPHSTGLSREELLSILPPVAGLRLEDQEGQYHREASTPDSASEFLETRGYPYVKGWPVTAPSISEYGISGSAKFADLDGDDDLEVILGCMDGKVYAWHHTGKLVANWPFTTASYIVTAPAVGDLDKDGFPEVVVASNDGLLYVLDQNAHVRTGWPKLVDERIPHQGGADSQSSPVLADIDSDSYLDIVFSSHMYDCVFVFNRNGERVRGWPRKFAPHEFNPSDTAVGDVDRDGRLEVAVGVMYPGDIIDEHYNRIHLWRSNGSPMKGWPVTLEKHYWSWITTVVIGDVNGDGYPDIAARDVKNVYVLDRYGKMLQGWPYTWMRGDLVPHTLCLANFDSSPDLEVVASNWDGIYLLDGDGSTLEGFPALVEYPIMPAVADIDGDGQNEIVAGRYYPRRGLYAWNSGGTKVAGFPLRTRATMYSTPLICDIDRDGDVDIGIGDYGRRLSKEHFFYMWDLPFAYNPQMTEWPTHDRDAYNSGFYPPQEGLSAVGDRGPR